MYCNILIYILLFNFGQTLDSIDEAKLDGILGSTRRCAKSRTALSAPRRGLTSSFRAGSPIGNSEPISHASKNSDFLIRAGFIRFFQEVMLALIFGRTVSHGRKIGGLVDATEVDMLKQSLLPGFPDGAQKIGRSLSILEKDGQVTYFVGGDNYFAHPEGDEQSRRFALTSLMENGHVRARDLEQAPLLIPHRTLMNWTKPCRREGPSSFYRTAHHPKARVMTPDKNAECAQLMAEGIVPSEVARRAGINESTLRKALKREAIPQLPKIPAWDGEQISTKSERSREDAQAASGLGTACTRADERVASAMGLATCATTRFESCHDVQMAGLLAGLPALCANGHLSGIDRHLRLPKGFYSALPILLTLGFMALGRIRRPEGLRHIPPGEFGKVIGLDRVPEVRTLREKIARMAHTGDPEAWMKELSKTWMENDPDEAGYLYVDGHIRVTHGDQANLPRRFVSRERLCLRGTTDYWVNDALGRPFFVVSKAVTEGLAHSLLQDIVPELLASVPGQPSAEALNQDPRLHRFLIVFDRVGHLQSALCAVATPHRCADVPQECQGCLA